MDSVHDILQENAGACCVNVGLSEDHDLGTLFFCSICICLWCFAIRYINCFKNPLYLWEVYYLDKG